MSKSRRGPLILAPALALNLALVRLVGILHGQLLAAETQVRPNIVLFLTDDQSQLDVSVYGARDLRTPNMQRLADAGLTFTHAFVASPSCAPSRRACTSGVQPSPSVSGVSPPKSGITSR